MFDPVPSAIIRMALNRNTEYDDLITQIDVFDEGLSVDQEALQGMDINNHKDIFRAVYIKVVILTDL